MERELHSRLVELPFKAVLIQCLDENNNVIKGAYGSGCILKEEDGFFLYTCWHVVTGYDPNNLKVKEPPRRKKLKVLFQGCDLTLSVGEVVGGLQEIIVELYENSSDGSFPLWCQDEKDRPQPDLNAINIRVPFWHDAVKIQLPETTQVSDLQCIKRAGLLVTPTLLPAPGDRIWIVGFPYGFSATGDSQPTPIVLTRYLASDRMEGRHREMLIESIGAPGMSGGPVFIDRGNEVKLLGLYSGLLFPDYVVERNNEHTALGTCINMMLCWEGVLGLMPVSRII